jgi:hypothetical protein
MVQVESILTPHQWRRNSEKEADLEYKPISKFFLKSPMMLKL